MKGAVLSLGSKSSKMTVEAMKKYFDVVEDVNLKSIEVMLGRKGMSIVPRRVMDISVARVFLGKKQPYKQRPARV